MLRRRIWKPRVAKTVRVRVRVRVNDDWGRQRIRVRECESASMNGARHRESEGERESAVHKCPPNGEREGESKIVFWSRARERESAVNALPFAVASYRDKVAVGLPAGQSNAGKCLAEHLPLQLPSKIVHPSTVGMAPAAAAVAHAVLPWLVPPNNCTGFGSNNTSSVSWFASNVALQCHCP